MDFLRIHVTITLVLEYRRNGRMLFFVEIISMQSFVLHRIWHCSVYI